MSNTSDGLDFVPAALFVDLLALSREREKSRVSCARSARESMQRRGGCASTRVCILSMRDVPGEKEKEREIVSGTSR